MEIGKGFSSFVQQWISSIYVFFICYLAFAWPTLVPMTNFRPLLRDSLTCLMLFTMFFHIWSNSLIMRFGQINDELPICSVITGDFNAWCSRWWRNDITNFAGKEIDFLTSSADYTQIIDKPTHVINKPKSCIDLIFCTNLNVISK